MNFSFLIESSLLQGIGWAVIHSLWQCMVLWLILKFSLLFTKKSSAGFRYNLNLLILFTGFIGFVTTLLYHCFQVVQHENSVIFISNSAFNNYQTGLSIISVIYQLLLIYYLLRFFHAIFITGNFSRKFTEKVSIDIKIFTKETAAFLAICKNVEIWISEHVNVPTVIGIVKPIILLPISAINHLTTTQLESILIHELAHIKRNDFLINLIQFMIETILFFNPFIHLISKSIRFERENCCDDWVINFKYNKNEYSNALLILEELRESSQLISMAATNGEKALLKRIKRLFYLNNTKTYLSFLQQLKISLLAIILLFTILYLPERMQPLNKQRLTDKQNLSVFPKLTAKTSTILESTKSAKLSNIASKLPKSVNELGNFEKKEGFSKKSIQAEPSTIAYYNTSVLEPSFSKNNERVQLVSNMEDAELKTSIVKIVDEQSGKNKQMVYYFKIDKNGSKTFITPILLINRQTSDSSQFSLCDSAILNPHKAVSL